MTNPPGPLPSLTNTSQWLRRKTGGLPSARTLDNLVGKGSLGVPVNARASKATPVTENALSVNSPKSTFYNRTKISETRTDSVNFTHSSSVSSGICTGEIFSLREVLLAVTKQKKALKHPIFHSELLGMYDGNILIVVSPERC